MRALVRNTRSGQFTDSRRQLPLQVGVRREHPLPVFEHVFVGKLRRIGPPSGSSDHPRSTSVAMGVNTTSGARRARTLIRAGS